MTVLAPLIWKPSPNFSARHGRITHLVWHATGGSYRSAVDWLATPTIRDRTGRVLSGPDASAHAIVDEYGDEVTQEVKMQDKAWHAFPTWNEISIGIEHASTGKDFASHAQLLESARLFAWLCLHHRIDPLFGLHRPTGIVRHRDLGAAGGGHVDGPTDAVFFHEFLPNVQRELVRGGFRKVYLR